MSPQALPEPRCQRCGKTRGDTIHHITSKDESIRMQAHEFEAKDLSFLDDPLWKVRAPRLVTYSRGRRKLLLFFIVSGSIAALLVWLL